MNPLRHILIIVMALYFMGCPVRSFYPLFGEKDLVFNPDLVGSWVEKGTNDTFFIQKGEGKDYVVVSADDNGNKAKYITQSGQLSKFWFLDTYPGNSTKDFQMIPTHLIWKISLNEDTLSIAALDGDFLKKLIQTGNLSVSHEIINEDVVLTASTDELQKLVLRYAEDTEAFPKTSKFVRIK